ncbi:MAG: PKD domain-containing protein [Gaiellaceae bacterium]
MRRARGFRAAAVVVGAVFVTLVSAASAATSPAAIAWPGSTLLFRDLTHGTKYHAAVTSAVRAWNKLDLGVELEPTNGPAATRITLGKGRCLLGRAGTAPRGFRDAGSQLVVTRSCPAIIRRLLLAHELGRVLGLPVDNKHCSLMNSHAVSDGLTYVVPAKCSRKHPPSWISRLIDPRTVALARLIYTAPPAPAPLALSVDPTGVPSVTWVEPAGLAAASIVVARTATACPTDRDVAAGTVTTVYRAAPSAGSHSVVDSSFPRTGENDCYRAFALNRWGRASLSSDAISYTFGGPIAGFAAEAAAAGAATTFTDASTAQHSSIARWTWNFGDPSSGAANTLDTTNPAVGQHPSHVYATAGAYDVTLTVTDSSARTSTKLQRIEVPG